jgi:hypothetical protein
MLHPDQIKPDMPVICSENGQFATVEEMEGTNYLKLKPDDTGRQHYIPLTWVSSIEDNKVKIDRPGEQAMREWSSVSPTF